MTMSRSALLLIPILMLAGCGDGFVLEPAPAPEGAASAVAAAKREPAAASPRSVPVAQLAEIAPLDRMLMPIEPFVLSFQEQRLRLSEDEAEQIERLAVRLRRSSDTIHVKSYASALDDEAGIKRAFKRGVIIRAHLLENGVDVGQIIVDAFGDDGGDPANRVEIAAYVEGADTLARRPGGR